MNAQNEPSFLQLLQAKLSSEWNIFCREAFGDNAMQQNSKCHIMTDSNIQ